ncbi:MAG: alpha-glucan family phosphorylase [Planctomycetota bacterium]|jgi:starch phosphorylase
MIAYFTMEIGLEPGMATYSGGLGMLAGDSVRSAADLEVPMVAVTLLHRRGYFFQRIDRQGRQVEEPLDWPIDDYVQPLPQRATVEIEGRTVTLRAWQRDVVGITGFTVPVLLLDTDLPENDPADRELTHHLYGGDRRYRLCQEVVLGIGGLRMLRALGHLGLRRLHMNEGHASLLAVELLREHMEGAAKTDVDDELIEHVRRQCVFTTHTPVPAGHDKFPADLVKSVLGDLPVLEHDGLFDDEGMLNMTYVALNLSRYVNGVAKRHGEVSRKMFSGYAIDSITNGVHLATWTTTPIQQLLDRHIPGWRRDNASVRSALSIPGDEVWEAHQQSKRELLQRVNRLTNAGLDADVFTIGFARRMTAYKRPTLLLSNPERLRSATESIGPIQVIFAGKAHPNDGLGKDMIKRIHATIGDLRDSIRIAYVPNYDMVMGRLICGGCDLWLNTPEPPLEASGTSGMKAAINAVPSLSTLDGWWIEGCIDGVTGWGFDGTPPEGAIDHAADAEALYALLDREILPLFYKRRERFVGIMQHAMALNGSFFNTERMMREYVLKAYF